MAPSTNETATPAPPVRILIINPNTSQQMTDALVPVVENLGIPAAQYTFFTCPTTPGSIPSINSPADAAKSAEICLPHLVPLLPHHDCFLVACYSQHPLVRELKRECAALTAAATPHGSGARKYVTGIFEASVLASLALLGEAEGDLETTTTTTESFRAGSGAFGIVSTGKVWEHALQTAVEEFLGCPATTATTAGTTGESKSRFVGCETTGLNASELHDLPPAEVRRKMMDATKRLLRRGNTNTDTTATTTDSGSAGAAAAAAEGSGSKPTTKTIVSRVKAICLGCAGMVGLDSAVRTACIEALGEERARDVYIVDGVKAGVGTLYALARAGF
ncbi:uncharacterized protein Z519_00460 [Cladophialophora bantiana CBS 173.52]|uniref:DCG1-like protein n=1 Tax=Cladophialophora bantiana (strain ATCC 10958 / CBS 173.52 / CDC B-1940 / NIH 8579) TaxID=1442370 RepID=A0A0D2GK63_CLAB1|nr:uncharacterized protein Z519_00460 [Cladophialophora bantiana CBS 173.52]KIW98797.1 hypothetical protein Z519_00460 [Cladophialophora bantiana CBS 173.52]